KFLISLDEFDYYELKNHSDFKDIKEYQKYLFNLNTTDNLDFAHIFYENYPRLPKYTPTN
ncbi:hypothetical protein, partial [Sutterella wadsworthensis]|uniref:hypothetical protein n=1 Tax=Sutterella wadsworthensis TaxID=40545 RepID=UPI0032C0E16E